MDASDKTTWFVVAINTKCLAIRYEMQGKLIPLINGVASSVTSSSVIDGSS
jgi:hypothetical protein